MMEHIPPERASRIMSVRDDAQNPSANKKTNQNHKITKTNRQTFFMAVLNSALTK